MKSGTEPRAVEAMWRAMPPQRLVDCGMLYGDTLALKEATAEGEEWDRAAEALGDAHFVRGQEQVLEGHLISATASFRAASAAFNFAQMPLQDGERKRQLYRRVARSFGSITALPGARVGRVEVPFGGSSMVGWIVMPERATNGVVVAFGGQSGWGACYARAADALAARGIATLLAEGPGQGETRLFRNVYLDVDVTAAYSRFVDAAIELTGCEKVGIWGNSLGGLFAALTAAADQRIGACCVNGGFAAPRLLGFRAFREQAAAMLGNEDPEAIQANFDRIAFDPVRHHIPSDLLVIHGGSDVLVSLDDQQPFVRGADPARTTVKVWARGDHTIYNYGDERNAFVSDWFADQLAS